MSSTLPRAGTSLAGRYRLERALGEGASSVVFAGRDLKLDRPVALKVLKPQVLLDSGTHRERFLNEARVLAKLAHPHIAPVFDVGETDEGAAFFVMELAGERTLARELDGRGQLSLEETLTLLLPVMGAVAMAHDAGIIHRDIKPANVVLETREQGSLRAKLLDFGIAKLSNADTSSGHALGTPAFMAPEQACAGEVRPSTDVWAMGVLLFRCLTGKLPFDAPASTGVLLKIVHERAPRFGVACAQLGPRVAVALDQALEPSPEARPQSMRDLARNLAAACRQDGVRLPLDPDPVGLPQFPEWFRSADVERTVKATPAPLAVPSAPLIPSGRSASARRSQRRLWLAAVIAVTAGLALLVMTNTPAGKPAAAKPLADNQASPVALSVPPPPHTDASSATLASSAPDASKPTAATQDEQKPSLKPKTTRGTRPAPAKSPPSAPTSKLIKQWDW